MSGLVALPRRDYLTRQELAEQRNVSVSTVDRWTRRGMPVERWSKRLVRYQASKVERWLDQQAA